MKAPHLLVSNVRSFISEAFWITFGVLAWIAFFCLAPAIANTQVKPVKALLVFEENGYEFVIGMPNMSTCSNVLEQMARNKQITNARCVQWTSKGMI